MSRHFTFCSPLCLLSLSLYYLNMQPYISSSSPVRGYLCVNHAPALTSLTLWIPSRFNQSASSQPLSGDIDSLPSTVIEARAKFKAVYFYTMSKIYAWISKGKQNDCVRQKAPTGPDLFLCRTFFYLFYSNKAQNVTRKK